MSVVSAGPSPGDTLNPVAVEAMAEEGIDISQAKPAVLTEEIVRNADVVIILGVCALAGVAVYLIGLAI